MYAIRSYYELILIAAAGSRLSDVLAGRVDPGTIAAALTRSAQWETLYDESLSYLASRITSYNVCYTKLLRDTFVQVARIMRERYQPDAVFVVPLATRETRLQFEAAS